jgi:YjbE family integral membrane protein
MGDILSWSVIQAFLSVVLIDLTLAGDNAIVIGMAAAGLPKEQRAKAIMVGIVGATVLRIGFASVTIQLLQLGGALLIGGGILLLWVCWKMWREIRRQAQEDEGADVVAGGEAGHKNQPKSFASAAWQIIIADISMSLDNVLAVAGAAQDHLWVMIFGLGLSIVLMGLAAGYIAKMLSRWHWIAYVGLALIFYVALHMIWEGAHDPKLIAWMQSLTA